VAAEQSQSSPFLHRLCTLAKSITAALAGIFSLHLLHSRALFAADCFGFLCLQAAELAAAVAADNSRAEAIFISGATGKFSDFINGIFDPTGEKGLDGRILYKNRSGDGSSGGKGGFWIVHAAGRWMFQNELGKGTDVSVAMFRGGCALEACKDKILSVYDGEAFEEQPDVKMATGAEAKAQASGASSIGHTCLRTSLFAFLAHLFVLQAAARS
jgi:hypothetical protein